MGADCWRPAGRLLLLCFSFLSAPPTLDGFPAVCRVARGHAWPCACLTCLEAGASSSCISPAFDCSIALMPEPSRVKTSGTGAALDGSGNHRRRGNHAGEMQEIKSCKRCYPSAPKGERGSQVTFGSLSPPPCPPPELRNNTYFV